VILLRYALAHTQWASLELTVHLSKTRYDIGVYYIVNTTNDNVGVHTFVSRVLFYICVFAAQCMSIISTECTFDVELLECKVRNKLAESLRGLMEEARALPLAMDSSSESRSVTWTGA
jgi:hypothetical protein